MREVFLDLDPEVLTAWKNDPATIKVFAFIRELRQAMTEGFAEIPVQSLSMEKIAMETVRLSGKLEMLDEILELKNADNDR